jgi:5-methylcytosine-specific restriction endonuclease McrA
MGRHKIYASADEAHRADLASHTKWRINNREKQNDCVRKWKRNNPDKVRCDTRNRIAKRRHAPGKHCAEEIQNLLLSQDYLCAACSIFLSTYHVDHIIPISRGGTNWVINLQILCPTCNMSKNNKTMDEWKPSLERKGT